MSNIRSMKEQFKGLREHRAIMKWEQGANETKIQLLLEKVKLHYEQFSEFKEELVRQKKENAKLEKRKQEMKEENQIMTKTLESADKLVPAGAMRNVDEFRMTGFSIEAMLKAKLARKREDEKDRQHYLQDVLIAGISMKLGEDDKQELVIERQDPIA